MRGFAVFFLSLALASQIIAQTPTNVIAASQLGYAPSSKKQFSSPAQFNSFVVKRISDDAIAYTGGAPLRSVTDAVIGGSTVWIGDFSAVTTPGRYKIVADGRESYPFDVRSDVFDQATRAAQRFFYYQRAFTAIEQPYAEGPWVHPTDAGRAPAGVVKGWHDAGDLTVYNATMTQAIFWLLETWSDFRPMDDNTNIPESGNGVPDLLDETRWGIEWLLSMQESNGGVWACATAANGTNSYPYGTTFPHTVAPYVKSAAPSTQVTAKAVAVLGYAAGVYRQYDTTFANRCLDAARRGWAWIVANPNQTNDGVAWGTGNTFNMYAQGGDQALLKTNKMWAAAGMLYATGEAQFELAFQTNFETIGWISSFSKSEAFAASLYLRVPTGANPTTKISIKQRIFQMADAVRSDANAHPFQFATYYYWGCNSNAVHRTGQFSLRSFLLDSTRTADRDQTLANLDYLFGRNFLNQVYVSGIDGVSKSRLRGFHQWMKALNASTWHFPGALAGGPNESPDGNDYSYPNNQPFPTWGYWGDPSNPRSGNTPIDARFTDNDSWCTNEVVVSWNAALVYNLYAARAIARGGSGVTVPTGTFAASLDTLPVGGGDVTLTWTSSNATSASIDQGIGIVTLNGSRTITVGQTKTFTLTLSNAGVVQTYVVRVVVPPSGGGNPQDITAAGMPVAFISSPTGNGSRNIEVIRDGITPAIGSSNPAEQYDTYNGGAQRSSDWIGYVYPSSYTFSSLVLQEGIHAANGGFFSGNPRVEVRVANQWVTATGISVTPAYNGSSGQNFASYTLTFNAVAGDGIRLAGAPGGSAYYISVAELRVMATSATGVGEKETTPRDYSLMQNYPNPFNPSTTIEFAVPSASRVTLAVYNLLGQQVRTLVDREMNEGTYPVQWDGRDDNGVQLSSGIYIYRMVAGEFVATQKMILSK